MSEVPLMSEVTLMSEVPLYGLGRELALAAASRAPPALRV